MKGLSVIIAAGVTALLTALAVFCAIWLMGLVPEGEWARLLKAGIVIFIIGSTLLIMKVFLDACVHCGACTDKCHYYLGTSDPKNMPVARQDLMRQVYRRYFTTAGKLFPKLVGAKDLTKDVLDDWYSYYYQCSECRRCSVFCPYGIDTAEITMAGREILNHVGMGQKYSNEILGKVQKIGNNLGLPGPALEDTLEGLAEDIEADTGVPVKLPLDVKGAEVLLVTPSADFFSEPHVESLIGYAKVIFFAMFRYSGRLRTIVIARNAATRQSHEIASLFVRNDIPFNVNIFLPFSFPSESLKSGSSASHKFFKIPALSGRL